ncbi:MAG: HAMP domain-containing histidine kinase [Gammaproteobacteria bacterium]|nr:HAMP domain-containing histidine kinase [Gammaproteobacteria bacterium]
MGKHKGTISLQTNHSQHNDPFVELLAGTTAEIGEQFFETLVKHLAQTFEAQFALVTELVPEKAGHVRTLAFSAHGKAIENIEYQVKGTPCEGVYDNGLTYVKANLQALFPDDDDLVNMGVNSYLGMPLNNLLGESIGHICVLGVNALAEHDHAKDYLKIFAARASAEMLRIKADKQLVAQREGLAQLVDEKTHELTHAKEAAESANRAKTEFLARMSHELKTPLHAISGFSQLMIEETAGELNSVYKEYADSMHTASKHLQSIIDELLDFSMIEIGKIKTFIAPCQVKKVIDSCIQIVDRKADEKNISITYANDIDNNAMIMVDESRLQEIIINLLTNAIKYNHDDGSVIIDIKRTDKNKVSISITDDGMGISKIEQAKVFTEFERLHADDQCIEGTGIGLAITKRLVEHMDGSISLQSKLGQGSSFTVEFPVAID